MPISEREEYERSITNPILTVPDEVCGLGELRNWVLDNFGEETIVMIDDDIVGFRCLTGEKSRKINDPLEFMQVIINTAVMAKDAGTSVFGFSQTDIRKYYATEPFILNTWLGGIIGVIGRKYRFRKDKFKVDIDFCLKVLMGDRIVWQDKRYTADQMRDNNAGGNAKFRTEDEYIKSVNSLKEKWGNCIKVTKHKNQLNINLKCKRRQAIRYE